MTTPAVDPDIFCCELSRELHEPMYGTALEREVWFLLEYNGPWRAKATSDNDLPQPVQEWLDAQLEAAVGAGRVQFIKQTPSGDGLTFFVGYSREQEPRLYRFTLPDYEALLSLDVPAVLAGNAAYEAHRQEEPIFLVCTNGRRDRCCALYGLAAYNALLPAAGPAAWQTTHVGGHRFAGNLLTFPDGTYYGRLEPEEVEALVEARRRDELYLPQLRGRACYEPVVQAADYFLRRETGQVALNAYRHTATLNPEEGKWQIHFTATDGATHVVDLVRELSDRPVYASCGKRTTKPVWDFRFAGHRVQN